MNNTESKDNYKIINGVFFDFMDACATGNIALLSQIHEIWDIDRTQVRKFRPYPPAGQLQYTPLQLACSGGHLEIVCFLKEAWKLDISDFTSLDTLGMPNRFLIKPIDLVCIHGHLSLLEVLINKWKMDIINFVMRDQGAYGTPRLFNAFFSGNIKFIRAIKRYGLPKSEAKKFTTDKNGNPKYSIVQWVCQKDDPACLAELKNKWGITRDDDAKETNSGGITPLHYACIHGYIDIVTELKNNWSLTIDDARKKTNNGLTPLHLACIEGNFALITELKNQWDLETTDILAKDNYSYTPYDYLRHVVRDPVLIDNFKFEWELL